MKNKFKAIKYISFWVLFTVGMTAVVFHSCDEGEEQPVEIAVTGISLDKTSFSLETGEEQMLTATVTPSNATYITVTWTSSNGSKATVTGGAVTAVAEGTATITAKAGNQTATCVVTVKDPPVFVIINGVKWATRNVDAPGTFAAKPESAGMFYQWNRKVAWRATGAVPGWDKTIPAGTEWEKANDPSPVGWRVPTEEEFNQLRDPWNVDYMWTKENNVNGWKFIDKTTGNSLFLPTPGYRKYGDGMLFAAGTCSYYWVNATFKNTENEQAGCIQLDNYSVVGRYEYRDFGFNVRSVAAD
jgi:uncharacterized protein (TIGR02145 family)